ncbi:hypothetical protein PACTADRAFT_87265 [Pachysolen tannophilus NRRL Y-2460]|uniref:Vacuolar ATPase assembly integral membrane protein VPH2 n=1 Tax=Pachysolen tannophilus NRRL Y-2460 TaxID=669874 RepID=A0A1E4TNT7_PACTA|nr:hypothetical protein PACTADRAFT_5456 [Pachysolen tannophilus NRRL Y-2460]ODV93401.1 hypothetical protein PACTADRAFT_87265 [Pachysolen tannophilus NRRL Y-2460]
MTRIILTDRILKEVRASKVIDEATKEVISKRKWISHNDLIQLCRSSESSIGLIQLLENADVKRKKFEEVEVPKSAEFLKNQEILKIRQQEYEYQQLIKSSTNSLSMYDNDFTNKPSQMAKELKHQLTTIVNILISVVSVMYAIWYWTGSSTYMDDGARILMSLFFGLLVLVAEVVVFNGYLLKLDDAKEKERKKKEVKKVVETVTFGKNKENE